MLQDAPARIGAGLDRLGCGTEEEGGEGNLSIDHGEVGREVVTAERPAPA